MESLLAFLDNHDYVTVRGTLPLGGTATGVIPAERAFDMMFGYEPRRDEVTELENVKTAKNSISFSLGDSAFSVVVAEPLTDRFGGRHVMGDEEETLATGTEVVCRKFTSDEGLWDIEAAGKWRDIEKHFEKIEIQSGMEEWNKWEKFIEFVEWVEKNHANLLGRVTEEVRSRTKPWSWTRLVAKQDIDWRPILDSFLAQLSS